MQPTTAARRCYIMKIIAIVAIILFAGFLVYFYGGSKWFANGLMQPGKNPELITYLQGDWMLADQGKTVFRIKRDSLIRVNNDSTRSANSLHYIFSGEAGNYFTKDSSFNFSASGDSLSNNNFILREVNEASDDTTIYSLLYVSKSKLKMISRGRTIGLVRLN
jgi:hypothetical protein